MGGGRTCFYIFGSLHYIYYTQLFHAIIPTRAHCVSRYGLITTSLLPYYYSLNTISDITRFDHILKTKGIYVLQYFQFLKWNLVIMPVLATGACCVLIGELWYAFR
jgi:hypothetical protein